MAAARRPRAGAARQFWGIPVGVPHLGGDGRSTALRAFRAGVPWETVLNSWNLLDSHDTARFRTIAGTPRAALVGVGLQMTLPGVPMVFAGDELGLEGQWGEDARRTMPWGEPRDEELPRRVPRLVRATAHSARARTWRDPLGARRCRHDRVRARDARRAPAVRRLAARRSTRFARRDVHGTTRCDVAAARDGPAVPRSGGLCDSWLTSRSTRSTRSTPMASRPSST